MKIFLAFILSCAIIAILVPSFVWADGGISIENPLKYNDIKDIIPAITSVLKGIAISIGTILIIVGGIQILTAGGSEEKLSKGKKTITWTVIGVAIVVLADFIVHIVRELLGEK